MDLEAAPFFAAIGRLITHKGPLRQWLDQRPQRAEKKGE
jgi:hypothetical protein